MNTRTISFSMTSVSIQSVFLIASIGPPINKDKSKVVTKTKLPQDQNFSKDQTRVESDIYEEMAQNND